MASVRLNHGSRGQIQSRITKALRAQFLTVPVPEMNAVSLYHKVVMSEEMVRLANQLDEKIPGIIRRVSDFYLDVQTNHVGDPVRVYDRDRVRTFYVDLPADFPMPNPEGTYRNTFDMTDEHELHPVFAKYIEQLYDIKKQNNRVNGVVSTVVKLCRTGGQLRLIWPELVTALPAYLRRELGNTIAKKPSRDWLEYPEQLLLQSNIRQATEVITKATLLEASYGGEVEVHKKLQEPVNRIRCTDI